MEENRFEEILSDVSVSVGHPDFFQEIYKAYLNSRDKKEMDPIDALFFEEYADFSEQIDKTAIQESCSFRNALKARKLAELLIGDDGKIDFKRLEHALLNQKNTLYSIAPDRHHDNRRNEQILNVLTLLKKDPVLLKALHQVSAPFGYPAAENLIRVTLRLDQKTAIGDAEARRAVLSAWLCYLRQNVGSCFATAPAIMVHDEQPLQFLMDIDALFSTGQLSRTFEGVQYAAPLCSSWGSGDLRKPFPFDPDPERATLPIWESPGLIQALSAVGILNEEQTLTEKIACCRELIGRVYSEQQHAIYSDIEKLIRCVLLDEMGLTEEAIKEEEERPPALIQGGVLIQEATSDATAQQVTLFHERLQLSYDSFKSLTDNPLLKSWEFTVASFAEVKPSLSRYNMYHSLGLGAQDRGGIGEALYQSLQQRIDTLNAEVNEHQEIYEQMYMQVKHLEGRLRRASHEEGQYLKQEYRNRLREMEYYERLRDEAHTKAHRFANLFNLLIDLYDEKFVEHFQEVYDPDIREVIQGPYDDSSAGFRLLYKGGRSAITTQWERINTPAEFSDALARFFVATERDIIYHAICEGIEEEVSTLITGLVGFVKTENFLESALYRMAAAYREPIPKEPLKNLDKVTKKPWVYISGGTTGSLVSAYFAGGNKPEEQSRWVENEEELLAFLLDTIKQLLPNVARELNHGNLSSFLMHSPTHAFLFKPYLQLVQKGWESNTYTYTWIKEEVVIPARKMIDTQHLDDGMIAKLLEQLRESLPKQYHHFFNKAFYRTPRTMHCTDFRSYVIEVLERDRALSYGGNLAVSADTIDQLLYRQLPMLRSYQIRDRVDAITQEILESDEKQQQQVMMIYDRLADRLGREEVIGASQLREIIQATLMLYLDSITSPQPLLKRIVEAMRQRQWMLPTPLVFADTNWVKEDFAMVVSPSTGRLELWRVDALALEGAPMSIWKEWLNGSRRDRSWGIYTNPFQYRAI